MQKENRPGRPGRRFAGPDDFCGTHYNQKMQNKDKKILMEKLTGKFLVAAPSMKDPLFEKTVIFIAGHDPEQGAIGMVINKATDVSMQEVYRQLGIENAKEQEGMQPTIGWGGPVQTTHGYILHSGEKGQKWDVTIFKNPSISVTMSPDIIFACARGEGPKQTYVVLGCAAWTPGQLEGEIEDNGWYVAPADAQVVFSLPVEERYDAALALVGLDNTEAIGADAAFKNLTQAGHA